MREATYQPGSATHAPAGRSGRRPTPAISPLDAQPRSLTDQAVHAIRSAAHSGQLAPGRLYSAYQISDLLGVSRAPVREALTRLAETGMVQVERNRGFRLVVPGPREVAEIFHLRLLLEVPAARVAASRSTSGQSRGLRRALAQMRKAARRGDEDAFALHDRAFHDEILQASGNQRLLATVGALRDPMRMLNAAVGGRADSLADLADAHAAIGEAIGAGDGDLAGAAMTSLLEHAGRRLVALAVRADGSGIDPDALWRDVVGDGVTA